MSISSYVKISDISLGSTAPQLSTLSAQLTSMVSFLYDDVAWRLKPRFPSGPRFENVAREFAKPATQ